MQTASQVQYELQDSGVNEALLHCYIPKDVSAREVDLSYEVDGISKGRVYIHFDSHTKGKLGCVQLDGFVFPQDIEAKFSKKQSKYTFRLIRAAKAESSSNDDRDSDAELDVDGPEHFSDAASSGPLTPTAAPADAAGDLQDSTQLPYPAAAANGNHHQQQEDAAVDTEVEAVDEGRQQDDAVSASADQQQADAEAEGDEDDADEQDQEGGAMQDEGAAKKAKKRRGAKKKKKKKKGAAGGSDAAEAEAASDADAAVSGVAAAPAEAEEEEVFVDAVSEGADDIASPDNQQAGSGRHHQQEQDQEDAASDSSSRQQASSSRPSSAVPPIVFDSDNYMSHFSEEPVAGSTALAPSPEEPLLLPASLLHGPTVHSCLDKHDVKGEDKGLNLKGCSWAPAGSTVATSFSAFGIFDGHGGKPAATYTSKELLPMVMGLVDRCIDGSSGSNGSPARQASMAAAAAAAGAEGGEDQEGEHWGVEVADEDRAVWAAQEALVDRLPKALFAGFLDADKACRTRHKVSGTTATLAVVVGWELIVANVGDSAAYLDTGREVLAVSGNHRIDDNPAEKARILAAGGEVEKSTADGKPVGPDRAWPGGLAMSRTIGDPQAPQVIAVPEIRHVTLPTTGGRLVIASDGVWDHMQPKSMIHQVRNQTTDAAAKKIAAAALKKKGLRDDISVLVVDLVPSSVDLRPPALLQGPQRDAVEPCQVMRPLLEVELEAAFANIQDRAEEGSAQLQQQLQTAASVTSVTAPNSHWREVATARRDSALQLLRAAAQREAEAAAAEAARLAELAARAEAEARGVGLSDTYKELAGLKIDVNAVVAQVQEEQQQKEQQHAEEQQQQQPQATADDEGWTTVGSGHAAAGASNGYVPFEQQLRDKAGGSGAGRSQQQRGQRGGSRGGRGGGGGRQQQQEQQEGADAAVVSRGEGGERGRGGRGRRDRDGRPSRAGRPGSEGRPSRDWEGQQDGQRHQQQEPVPVSEGAASAAAGSAEEQQQFGLEGRGRGRSTRGGFGGRGSGFRGEHGERFERFGRGERPPRRERGPPSQQRLPDGERQPQQQEAGASEGPAAVEGPAAAELHEQAGGRHQQQQQQQEYHGGRGRGSRRGRGGGRGENWTEHRPPAAAADGAQRADHADVAHSTSSFDQHAAAGTQHHPRQQQYARGSHHQQDYGASAAANGNADAGAGVHDACLDTPASSSSADAALKKPAVRVVPRPKPSMANGGSSSSMGKGAELPRAVDGGASEQPEGGSGGGDRLPHHQGGRGGGGYRGGREGGHRFGGHRGRFGGGYRGGGRGGFHHPPPQQQQQPQPQQA